MEDLNNENCKTLKEEIRYTKFCIGKINLVIMAILPKKQSMYQMNYQVKFQGLLQTWKKEPKNLYGSTKTKERQKGTEQK